MRITTPSWLDEIEEKLAAKHAVSCDEAEEALGDAVLFRYCERGSRPGEDLYSAFGRTDAGRLLMVFFVYKRDQSALITSARDMSGSERRYYERQGSPSRRH